MYQTCLPFLLQENTGQSKYLYVGFWPFSEVCTFPEQDIQAAAIGRSGRSRLTPRVT